MSKQDAALGIIDRLLTTAEGFTGTTITIAELQVIRTALGIPSASAPELLEAATAALKALVKLCNNHTEGEYGYLCNDLGNAIRKAKGED